jgi:hypothetical protein
MARSTAHAYDRFKQRAKSGGECSQHTDVEAAWEKGIPIPKQLAAILYRKGKIQWDVFYRWVPEEDVVFVWAVVGHEAVLVTALTIKPRDQILLQRTLRPFIPPSLAA